MKIDVIIPVYKAGAELFSLLDRLENQTVPVRKIILMHTESRLQEAGDRENGTARTGEGFEGVGTGERDIRREECRAGKSGRDELNHGGKSGRDELNHGGKSDGNELTGGVDFCRRYPNAEVHHISKHEFDHGGTRHQGVQYSEADVFVMMTQDAMPADSRLIERLTENLMGNVAAAYARQLPGEDSSEFERASRTFNYPEASRRKSLADLDTLGIKTFFCSNVCAAYRRDIYEKLGGFIRHTIFNEDMIYAAAVIKAGYSVSYEAQAQVVHAHNYTNIRQLRRNFDLGVSQAQHPEVFGAAASEAEGKKLVAATWRYLRERKRLYRFPGFCVQCAFKYAGYLLGRHYKKLPRGLVMKITENREYWNKT